MLKVTRLAQALKTILTEGAEKAARLCGWYKREPSKLDASRFSQTLVLGWLGQSGASLEQLSQTTASLGTPVSAQALDQRFNAESAELMHQVLGAAVKEVFGAEPVAIELLDRFTEVQIADSSIVGLPEQFEQLWNGCGSGTGQGKAAMKLFVSLSLKNGTLHGPLLAAGRCSDRKSPLWQLQLPPGALSIEDLGFFSTEHFAKLDEQGVYWLSRLQAQTALYHPETGERLELFDLLPRREAEVIDMDVLLGAEQRLPVRLIAVRVPPQVANERRRRLRAEAVERRQNLSERRLALCDWTLIVTNVPSELLSPKEAMVLLRARWQIERLFRLWKQHGLIDESRSSKPWRVLTELYAKLLAVLIQHWCTLTALWDAPARSLFKAAQTIRQHAALITSAFRGVLSLEAALEQIRSTLSAGCKLNSRRKAPNTYQFLENPNLLNYL